MSGGVGRRPGSPGSQTPAPIDGLGPPPAIPGLVIRRVDVDRDVAAIAELISIANRHDGVDWLPRAESLRHDWEHDAGLDPDADLLVAEVDGTAIGIGEHDWRLRAGRVFHQVQPLVHPEWRHRGVGRVLLEWAEHRAAHGAATRTMGPPDATHILTGWGDLEIPDIAPFAAAAGYHVETYGVMMTRPLADPIPDAALPDGLEVRPVRPEDHRRIWDADCEAFQDHRDPATRTEADFERWFTTPDLDTGLWQVAWAGDEVAGSVMPFIYPDENEQLGIKRGWLEHISVRRPWRKRGLASALMVRSMRWLRDLGLAEAALGADAENLSGAVRLYERLGFRRVRTAANYRKAMNLHDRSIGQPRSAAR
jgi:GNAT superfamily N-acetyltransferase